MTITINPWRNTNIKGESYHSIEPKGYSIREFIMTTDFEADSICFRLSVRKKI